MARQRTPRANKRNLVRWTDDMDKKLLLSIQSECNAQGVNIPWNNIATLVGPTITGSAVIQHLAKLRIRMVQQGLSVPPPLRRGGGQRISTGLSIPPSGRAAKNSTSAPKGPPKPRRVRTKKLPSEETDSEEYESGSDAEYGKPRAKRAKIRSKAIPHTPTPSTSESEEEIVSSARRDVKREASVSSDDESSGDDYSIKEDGKDGEEVVAAGAEFLDLVDDVSPMGQIAPEPVKSLIVKLPAKKTIKPESPNLGRNDLDHLATVASGLPAYTSTSAIDNYPGFDLSVQSHRDYPHAEHEYNSSEILSARYGARNGLPESSLYGSMISQPHMSYSNGFEHFSDTNLGDQDMVEDGWNSTNSDYHLGRFDGSCTFTTPPFFNAGHPPSSLSQLSTSFMPGPAVHEDTVGGEHFSSSGSSTLNHTPSSFGRGFGEHSLADTGWFIRQTCHQHGSQ